MNSTGGTTESVSGGVNATGGLQTTAEFPHYLKINTSFFCCLIFVVGVFGNLLVPLVIWKNKDMRNSTNISLVNLSVADLLVLIVCMPTVIVEIHSAQPESWILGEGMCKAVPFLELTVAHGSVFTILAISIERYYAICRPLTANYKLTKVRALVMIVSLWIVAGVATGPVLIITDYTERDYLNDSRVNVCVTEIRTLWESIYIFVAICALFFLPLIILVVIYSIIIRQLMVTTFVVGTRLQDTTNMRARRQVVFMLVTVVVFFFICLLPIRVFMLWIIFTTEENIESLGMETYYNLLFFCRIMLYINSAINPILYNVMSSKFREAFLCTLGWHNKDKRKKLDRQTTFNTTYTSLSGSSIKGSRTGSDCVAVTTNGHFLRQNSSHGDSAV